MTSAPEPRLASIELRGRLVDNAHAAHRQADDAGHFMPVLCFDVQSDDTGVCCRVEQFFPQGQEEQCKHAAHRLKRGMLVSFQVNPAGLRFKATGVSHVHAIEKAPPPHTEPAQAEARQAEIAA